MSATLPGKRQVLKAVDTYLGLAYQGQLPLRVRSQRDVLETWKGELFECPLFSPDTNISPARYTVRLGNQAYPHMKVAIELAPNGEQYLYKVDTHDRHCCPGPESPEYGDFNKLMDQNQKYVETIEAAWEKEGVPTFKAFLRDDLKRRQAALRI